VGLGCGDDENDAEEGANVEVATEGVQGLGDNPVDEGSCERFCEKANECARAAGREVPAEAADCERSCAPGGVHRQAPAAIHACASETCGPAFMQCSQRAMIDHMRGRDVAVFPPQCVGLCEKSAWCHRRAGQDPAPGEDDCEAACQPGGAFAEVTDREVLCVHQPCGAPFATCRQEGGPSGPVEVLPPPTMPEESDSP
jgi:hypothetical protein